MDRVDYYDYYDYYDFKISDIKKPSRRFRGGDF